MRLVLAWWLNMRLITLNADNIGREYVGVRLKDGEYRYVQWRGFLSAAEAKARGRPVKLRIARVGEEVGFAVNWRHQLDDDQHVQGCLTSEGAYVVVDVAVRIL